MTKEKAYEEATLKNLSDPKGTRQDIIYAAMDIYVEPFKRLLRIAGVPELLIENPDLLNSQPSVKDIEWAKSVISKYD